MCCNTNFAIEFKTWCYQGPDFEFGAMLIWGPDNTIQYNTIHLVLIVLGFISFSESAP